MASGIGIPTCSACGQKGHRKNQKLCPLHSDHATTVPVPASIADCLHPSVFPDSINGLYDSLFEDLSEGSSLELPDEGSFLEYKSYLGGRSSFPKINDDLARYVVAFLNSQGGMLIGGIVEENGAKVVGVPLDARDRDQLNNVFAGILNVIQPIKLSIPNDIQLEFIPIKKSTVPTDEESIPKSPLPRYLMVVRVFVHTNGLKLFHHHGTIYQRNGSVVQTQSFREVERLNEYDPSVLIQHNGVPQAIDYMKLIEQNERKNVNRTSHKKLPVYEKTQEIVNSILHNRVTILDAETGSGKSTQVPKMLIHDARIRGVPCPHVYVCQQRRVACVSLARRVSEELGLPFPSLVGYHIGGANSTTGDTRIKYLTNGVMKGVLKTYLQASEARAPIDVVILDEVHELHRDLDGECCLVLLKHLLAINPSLRIVLMSATLPGEEILSFFPRPNNLPYSAQVFIDNAAQQMFTNFYSLLPTGHSNRIKVAGRRFVIQRLFLDELPYVPAGLIHEYSSQFTASYGVRSTVPVAKIPSQTLEYIPTLIQYLLTSRTIHNCGIRQLKGILIFLPGLANLLEVQELLSKSPIGNRVETFLFHSSLPSEDQKKCLTRVRRTARKIKVILATNIAESSITLPDISVVIDTCTNKEDVYDVSSRESTLVETWAPKMMLLQREGRIGRVQPGLSIKLIPKSVFEKNIPATGIPKAKRCSTTTLLLNVLNLPFPPDQFLSELPHPPDRSTIGSAFTELLSEGLVTQKRDFNSTTFELTQLGKILLDVPLSLSCAKLAFNACVVGLGELGIIMACIIDRRAVIKAPVTKPAPALHALHLFSGGTRSDVIASVNAYLFWLNNRFSIPPEKLAAVLGNEPYFLSLFWLNELHDLVLQVRQSFSAFGIVPSPTRVEMVRNTFSFLNDEPEEEVENEEEFSDEEDTYVGVVLDNIAESSNDLVSEEAPPAASSSVSSYQTPNHYINLSGSSSHEKYGAVFKASDLKVKLQDVDFFQGFDFPNPNPETQFLQEYLTMSGTGYSKSCMLMLLLALSFPSNIFTPSVSMMDIFSTSANERGFQNASRRLVSAGTLKKTGTLSFIQTKSEAMIREFIKPFSTNAASSVFVGSNGMDWFVAENFSAPVTSRHHHFNPPFTCGPASVLFSNVRFGKGVQTVLTESYTDPLFNADVSPVFSSTRQLHIDNISLARPLARYSSSPQYSPFVVSARSRTVSNKRGNYHTIYSQSTVLPVFPHFSEKLSTVFLPVMNIADFCSARASESTALNVTVGTNSKSVHVKATTSNKRILVDLRSQWQQLVDLALEISKEVVYDIKAERVYRLLNKRERLLGNINEKFIDYAAIWNVFVDFFEQEDVFIDNATAHFFSLIS
ncbi:hypothetical protein RCL1_004551 [Eukaryota sp. TZLM3-RCL]